MEVYRELLAPATPSGPTSGVTHGPMSGMTHGATSGPTSAAAPRRAGQPRGVDSGAGAAGVRDAENGRGGAGVRARWGVTGVWGAWGAPFAASRASVRTAHLPKTVRARRTDHVPGGGSVPCTSCAVRAAHTTGAEATECRESSHT
jgi:hypothetical protein